MSGGAVLNERGELIGIHGRAVEPKVEPSEINPSIAVLKTSYNLGVPINTYLSLVPKVDATLAVGIPTPPPQSTQPKADDFFLQAQEKYKNADYQGAIRDYDQAIALNSQYAEAYAGRGEVRGDLGDFQGALQDSDRAIVLNPQLADAYTIRSGVRGNMGNWQRALQDANQAVTLNPKSSDAYYSQAGVKAGLKDYRGAVQDLTKAITIRPNFTQAYYYRGSFRAKLNDRAGALADYQKVAILAQEQKNTTLYNNALKEIQILGGR
jgi:tetratricopeptide (TPR) repeat protein